MHAGFLVVSGDKMSKSTGEFLTLDLLQEKGFDPLAYRLLCLGANYGGELSWSWQALESAQQTLKKMEQQVITLRKEQGSADTPQALSAAGEEIKAAFAKEIFNNLNMPRALALVHKALREPLLSPTERLALVQSFDEVLGLGIADWKERHEEFPQAALELLEQRESARTSRNWKRADEIRANLADMGFIVEDGKDGAKLKRK